MNNKQHGWPSGYIVQFYPPAANRRLVQRYMYVSAQAVADAVRRKYGQDTNIICIDRCFDCEREWS